LPSTDVGLDDDTEDDGDEEAWPLLLLFENFPKIVSRFFNEATTT